MVSGTSRIYSFKTLLLDFFDRTKFEKKNSFQNPSLIFHNNDVFFTIFLLNFYKYLCKKEYCV